MVYEETKSLYKMMDEVYVVTEANGWYDDSRNFGVDIALLHSEVSEMFEGFRNNDWANVHEEAADIFIRLLDTCRRYNIDLEDEYEKKMKKNKERDYKHGGKVV